MLWKEAGREVIPPPGWDYALGDPLRPVPSQAMVRGQGGQGLLAPDTRSVGLSDAGSLFLGPGGLMGGEGEVFVSCFLLQNTTSQVP